MLHPFLTGSLNRDICKHTFGFLDKCALAVCRQVCTTWRDLIRRPEPWTLSELWTELQKSENPAFVHITSHIYLLPLSIQVGEIVYDVANRDNAWALDWLLRRNVRGAQSISLDMKGLGLLIARAQGDYPRVCAWYWNQCQYSHLDRCRCFWTFFYEATPRAFRAMLHANVIELSKLTQITGLLKEADHDEWLARRKRFPELQLKCKILHEPQWNVSELFWEQLCDQVWRDTRRHYKEQGIEMLRCIGTVLGTIPKHFCMLSRDTPIYDTKMMHDEMMAAKLCACPRPSGMPAFVPDSTAYPTPALLNMTNKKRTRDDEPPPN